jgi:hypothetical protein
VYHISSNRWYICNKLCSVTLEGIKFCIADVVVVKRNRSVYFTILRRCMGTGGGAVG